MDNRVSVILVAGIAVLALFFTWFYMPHEYFCFSVLAVIVFLIMVLVYSEYLKLRSWFKDTVSIQVVIHKNEKSDDKDSK